MSLYFEDFAVDSVSTSRSRTITESDIVNFAGLSGDFVELHMSETYAAQGPFKKRIAHGALIFSISTGLSVQLDQITDTVIAFYGVDKLRFTRPVFIGDTVHLTKKVVAKEPKGAGRGVVTFETTVLNQRGETVIVYYDKVLLKART
ncbi:MAG TPA: MaoC/PaaZ C-terminal domain-containing protein [Bryobacteraceae bacterium]|nr:MaoC/PaaZ C-terminal domain-containing protein [Bryobacteraceae bacterium]